MALKGQIKDLSVADLVKIHCIGRVRACVKLSHTDSKAELYFEGGKLIAAQFDSVGGEDAVYKALSLSEGSYKVELNATPEQRTVRTDWTEILNRWEHTSH
jgi:hypothetical protein